MIEVMFLLAMVFGLVFIVLSGFRLIKLNILFRLIIKGFLCWFINSCLGLG